MYLVTSTLPVTAVWMPDRKFDNMAIKGFNWQTEVDRVDTMLQAWLGSILCKELIWNSGGDWQLKSRLGTQNTRNSVRTKLGTQDTRNSGGTLKLRRTPVTQEDAQNSGEPEVNKGLLTTQ